jgi:hypothetical protein
MLYQIKGNHLNSLKSFYTSGFSIEFPLELKLIVMFKIWSFALFYAFFLPYITFLISLAMICLYLLEKRNLYSHYSQRRYLGVELEIKFLNIYINFFCIYECLIYILNV